jgi:hypothetical protein
MLKKISAMFLTKLYLITVLGFVLNLHYCGTVLAGVKINSPAKTCHPFAARKMKCCKDKEVDVKVKDAHQVESTSPTFQLFGFEIPKLHFGDFILSAQQALLEKLADQPAAPPPPPAKVDPVIKNRTLRI